jgi:hypothetical protein
MSFSDRQEISIIDQDTQPLPGLTFQLYLATYHLDLLDIAIAARVRYLTVWNIAHAIPVRASHAALVRAALYRLTGIAYAAPIPLLS